MLRRPGFWKKIAFRATFRSLGVGLHCSKKCCMQLSIPLWTAVTYKQNYASPVCIIHLPTKLSWESRHHWDTEKQRQRHQYWSRNLSSSGASKPWRSLPIGDSCPQWPITRWQKNKFYCIDAIAWKAEWHMHFKVSDFIVRLNAFSIVPKKSLICKTSSTARVIIIWKYIKIQLTQFNLVTFESFYLDICL